PILSFSGVDYETSSPRLGNLVRVDADLAPGDLLLVLLDAVAERCPLCDLAEGLLAPTRGVVLFRGEDWQKMSPFSQIVARGRIGRVFEGTAWISNLTVLENVTLAQRHHTRRPEGEIREEAEKLARRVGLAEIPTERLHLVRQDVLKRAQWVRAFLGSPLLILLEQPEADAPRNHLAALIELASEARSRGSALIWTTRDAELWRDQKLNPTLRYRVENDRLLHTREER
ncbi:MAG: hypothetical protein ACUVWX_13655, partial [Kiritimatiellia bacterium]